MSCAISFFELNFLPRYENSLHVSQHSVKGIIIRTTICGKQMCAKFAWIYTYIYGYAYVCIQGDRSIDIYTYIFICRLAQTHKSSGLFEIAPLTWGLDTLHKLRYQRAYTASHAECATGIFQNSCAPDLSVFWLLVSGQQLRIEIRRIVLVEHLHSEQK